MANNLNTNDVPFDRAFAEPASLYRGAPFWSWNGQLERDELLRQIDVFDEMGIGGVTIHSRTGLATEYLGDEFMELVKASRDHAHAKGMLTWLYDEDRWPSGFGGGFVTSDPKHRAKFLLFTPTPYGQGKVAKHTDSTAAGTRQENGELLARYAVRLDDGRLADYRMLADDEQVGEGETCWYAYLETANPSPWFNNQTYVDTLSPEAMQRFIEVTHERYKQVLGEAFGKDVPAIFTDEPQFTHKRMLRFADQPMDLAWPWTVDLDEAFAEQFGESILAHFPEVVWDLPDRRVSLWRYRYHEWVAERFSQSFSDQLGQWCDANGLALTGHMMEESTLAKQTKALGEAMRSYRTMHIPGIDMLCDWEELTTAKQAQSAARQYGRAGVMSELYGVTGWHYPFEGHKRQGDWQAALGVLFRVHHLSWYCMKGEAKRDYPASISYQSPWYTQYHHVEDHFARVGATLSRGKPVCRVGVIHPVESYWLCAGPNDTSGAECGRRDDEFQALNGWLIHGLIDFDYIAESLLPDLADKDTPGTFGVGECAYEAVLVPGMRTIRSTTLDRLEAFADGGGRVIFVGEVPTLVDAVASDRPVQLAARCEQVAMNNVAVLDALSPHRDIDLVTPFGSRPSKLVYQMRAEGDDRYLFLCYMGKDGQAGGTLRLRGHFAVEELDTATGQTRPIAATYTDDQTRVDLQLLVVGHALLKLTPGKRTDGESLVQPTGDEVARLTSPVPITLDEPNVLLFDKATFRINDGDWQDETQLLDIENVLRAELGLPRKFGQIAQPWTDKSPVTELATITLRLPFTSQVPVSGAQLALENLAESAVTFDGQPVDTKPTGYFTDKAIQTIALPDFDAGEHVIAIALRFTKETSIEWCYLLGDFGVTLRGDRGIITEPVRELSFGNWTAQGLPFYGGNVTYHCTAPCDGAAVQTPQLDGTAVNVTVGNQSQFVYRPPYVAHLPLQAGDQIDFTVYGHRANCFGPVHMAEPIRWLGPQTWRTKGTQFSREFQLKPLGIRTAPIVYQ